MPANDKNKTVATVLALLFGAAGFHRFYLHGRRDRWGWLHVLACLLGLLMVALLAGRPWLFGALPAVLSALCGCLEALVIGLTPDERWNARFRPQAPAASGWPLAVLLVVAVALGATGLIATIARLFDLFFTGGAYG